MRWHPGTVDDYLTAWGVTAETTMSTPSSDLIFGDRRGTPVVLKVPRVEEEARASAVLAWWAGRGAATVLEHDDHAVLMRRATGGRDLAAWSGSGRDDEATRVLAGTGLRLHSAGLDQPHPPGLVPLTEWFRALVDGEHRQPSAWTTRAADIARHLLAATPPGDEVVLHGDIHHGNVLDFDREWAAIDPKGLRGHRAFDFANIFCNPGPDAAAHLERRVAVVSEVTALGPPLLAAWVVSWCALSVRWQTKTVTRSWQGRGAEEVASRMLPLANRL